MPLESVNMKGLRKVAHINEGDLKDHLGKIVLRAAMDTLNALLDADADEQAGSPAGDIWLRKKDV